MTVLKLISRTLFFVLLVNWMVVSCTPNPQATLVPTYTATVIPTLTATIVPSPSPTVETTPDTGWIALQPGLERRLIRMYNDQNQHFESLYIFRLSQNQFRLDIAYHETPQSLENWQTETNALIVVNGGYFRVENEKYIPNGLTIINGGVLGSSYDSFAGMLAISDEGAELRWLAEKSYNPNEILRAGLQSFPMLVKPGGELGFPVQREDNLRARRTVIGQDKAGNILFIVAPRGYFTLHQLSVYLTEGDLDLDIAINLDGGPSTGILVANPYEIIPSQTVLPIVILAYAR